MKFVLSLLAVGAVALLSGCAEGSPTAATTTESRAATTSAEVATTPAELPSDEVLSARAAVVTMYGEKAGPYLDQVNEVWPLTTPDRVYTAGGYAVAICAAKDAGVDIQVANQHVVDDFQELHNVSITQEVGEAIVRAAWGTVCS